MSRKFVWGCTAKNASSDAIATESTWHDACIYLEEDTGRYEMILKLELPSEELTEENLDEEIETLHRIASRLEKYMCKNSIPRTMRLFPFGNPNLSGQTLTEVYVKLRAMIEGYKRMMMYLIITNNQDWRNQ